MTAQQSDGNHRILFVEDSALEVTNLPNRFRVMLGTYRWAVVIIFALAVGLKVYSLVKGEFREWESDPVLGLSTTKALWFAVLAELGIIILAAFDRLRTPFLVACVCLFGVFVVYHGFSFLLPSAPPCNCLGASLSKQLLNGLAGRVTMATTSGLFLLAAALLLRSLYAIHPVPPRGPDATETLPDGNQNVGFIMFWFFMTVWPSAFGSSYVASGEVNVEFFGINGSRLEQPSYNTSIAITISEDGRFLMRMNHHPVFRSHEITFSFDGTNFFYVFGAKIRSKDGEEEQKARIGPTTAYLSTGDIPMVLFQDDARDALWLALGSGQFFQKHGPTGELVNLFYGPRTDINAYGFRYEATLTNSTLPLAYKIHLLKDKSLDGKNAHAEEERIGLDLKGKGSDLRRKQWGMKETWRDGDRALDLSWHHSQMIGSTAFPLEVAVTTYYPSPHSNQPRHKIGIRIDSWQTIRNGNENFQPPVKAPIRVFDSRLRSRNRSLFVDDVMYEVGRTNSQWPSTNDVSLQRAFTSVMEANQRPDALMPQVFRFLLFATAAGGLAITVILLVRRKGKVPDLSKRPISSGF